MVQVDIICDGQFGSTGKGLLASWIAKQDTAYSWFATNAGAQSGHTSYYEGKKIVAFHLSTAGIHTKLMGQGGYQFLSAGCIIDPKILLKEIQEFGYSPHNLFIHPQAAFIEPHHKRIEMEGSVSRIASTAKGVGASLADKVMRRRYVAEHHPDLRPYIGIPELQGRGVLEIPQGFSLGINSGFYPYCTSRECTVMQGLSDLRMSYHHVDQVYMCVRTYPIRVGNTDRGNSGGWYEDQQEVTWEQLGQEPELTTVTKRERRIATFSFIQYEQALKINRPDTVLVNFANYMNKTELEEFKTDLWMAEKRAGYHPAKIWGFGPKVGDIRKEKNAY